MVMMDKLLTFTMRSSKQTAITLIFRSAPKPMPHSFITGLCDYLWREAYPRSGTGSRQSVDSLVCISSCFLSATLRICTQRLAELDWKSMVFQSLEISREIRLILERGQKSW